jgi:hypothetical protein
MWPEPTPESWIGVLKLSSQWEFVRARKAAIFHLDRVLLAPAKRVHLARQFSIQGWQVPALQALILRADAMDKPDVELLGIETVLKIASLRENYGGHVTSLRKERYEAELKIHKSYNEELSSLRKAHDADATAMEKKHAEIVKTTNSQSYSTRYYVCPPVPGSRPSTPPVTSTSTTRSALKVSNQHSLLVSQLLSSNWTDQTRVNEETKKIPRPIPVIIRETFDLGPED